MEKVKEIFNIVKRFVIEEKRYFIAAVLFLLMVLVLVKCTGPASYQKDLNQGTELSLDKKGMKECKDKEILSLMDSYFTAYASMDVDTLETIAVPLSDNEKSYIGVFGQYIENYSNIKVYSTETTAKDKYLVSVAYDLKFYQVDTVAPGLDFFYVEKNEEGKYYINNR